MIRTVITSVALLATSAIAQGIGQAIVVNNCPEPVTLTNVPAGGGGQSQVGPQSLNTGGSYSQQYTKLNNDGGWSMKLTKADSGSSLLQYEYTFLGDGVIWYDLSAVNGDPFNGDWGFSATGGCNPKNTAYRNPTDDTYGMQSSCPQSSSVTVTLCASGGGSPAPPGSAPSGAPSQSPPQPNHHNPPDPAPQPDPSMPTPDPPTEPAPADPGRPDRPDDHDRHHHHHHHDHHRHHHERPPGSENIADEGQFNEFGGVQDGNRADATVTDVQTVVQTVVVTMSPSPVAAKRDEHLRRHVHHHNHF